MKYLRHLFCSAFFCAVFSASGEEMPNILRNEALSFEVGGHVGERLSAKRKDVKQIPLLENNRTVRRVPASRFRIRCFKCMWHGEFGKILAGVAQTYLATRNPATLTVGPADDRTAGAFPAQRRIWAPGRPGAFRQSSEKWIPGGITTACTDCINGTGPATDKRWRSSASGRCLYDYFILGKRSLRL